jgi:hypothetical protein
VDLVLTLNAWVPVAEGVLLVLQARESAGALRGISADDPLRQSLLAEEKEGLSGLKRGMSFTAAPYSDSSSGLWGIGDSLRSGCILGQPKAGGN